ncbi:MAG: RIO1 family regulatory kinase/ATPase [Deinococcales bacterium]
MSKRQSNHQSSHQADYFDVQVERFRSKKREPQHRSRKRVDRALLKEHEDMSRIFIQQDPNLIALEALGFIEEVISEIKSGKEATVYLVKALGTKLAAKVYKDLNVRSFKRENVYQQGRFIGDARAAKALEKRSHFGKQVQQSLWVTVEYAQMWQLYQAGLRVPKPALGPESTAYAEAGRVVLMEFIGDDISDTPAPRLSDVRLNAQEAQRAFEQSFNLLQTLKKLGKVHGDFSAYNLLWHQNEVILIDFPQLCDIKENPEALRLLERDLKSLCQSFRRHGIETDDNTLWQRIRL